MDFDMIENLNETNIEELYEVFEFDKVAEWWGYCGGKLVNCFGCSCTRVGRNGEGACSNARVVSCGLNSSSVAITCTNCR